MSVGKLCDRKDCRQYARYRVVVEYRANPFHDPIVATVGLAVCEAHSRMELADVMTEALWQRVVFEFQFRGLKPPKRQYSNVAVVPLTDEEIRNG